MFDITTNVILGLIAALAATIVLYVMVLPKSKDGTFNNKWWQFIFDFFHFKKLYLEEILKFIFTLATISCLAIGFFVMIGYTKTYSWYGGIDKESTFLSGLLIMVAGPVALRLTYEGLLMFILLVKNTMEINNKLKKQPEKKEEPEEPTF